MVDLSRTALLVGATGLIGGHVLSTLLERSEYSAVTALVRRPTGKKHDKLRERIIDFEDMAAAGDAFDVTDVYACLGTTIKVAGSQERFRQVDHDYTVNVAKLAKQHGASRLAVVSSIGASAAASSFYMRVKGETEDDVRALGFSHLVIAQPSILIGERTESRPGERVGIVAMRALDFAMFGALRKYRAIDARTVAQGMIRAMLSGSGEQVLRYDELRA
jgi:uncharacterized protein YbjT (DUF2867 family)